MAIRLPGKSGAVSDPIADIEDRIDTFFEEESINYINISEYLKALGLYEEKQKYQASHKLRQQQQKQ